MNTWIGKNLIKKQVETVRLLFLELARVTGPQRPMMGELYVYVDVPMDAHI